MTGFDPDRLLLRRVRRAKAVQNATAIALVLLAYRATAPLGDALDRQRRFVADASHELRTPLTQLHTRVQLLRHDLRDGAAPEQIAPDVERLLVGTRQLGEVVEDLLLSTQLRSRTDAGTEVDLGVVAAGVVAALGDRARDQGVELILVPDADEPSVARGHGDHRRFGLGLALAREVITGHGGTIDAWGRPGQGATFTVHLPADAH